MTIAVDLHLVTCGIVGLLSLVCLLVHLALGRGSSLAWLMAATLCVLVETLLFRYAGPSTVTAGLVAILVASAYFAASQAIGAACRLSATSRRITLCWVTLTALSLALLAFPVEPTVRYIPFQLAGILVFLDTIRRLARAPKRGVLENGMLVLGLLTVAGNIVRIPMFPALLGQPTPWAIASEDTFTLVFMPAMGLLTMCLVALVIARIVASVIGEYRHSAERDGLTELLNRRAFDALIDKPASSRGAIVMCDIDRFTAINDRFGHQAGDEVIRSFACMLSLHGDYAGRVGGEEFALLLLDTSLADAAEQAEGIRSAFDGMCHPAIGPSAQFSASFGVAAFEAGTSIRTAMRDADRALYSAKRNGRNLVTVAQGTAPLDEPLLSAA